MKRPLITLFSCLLAGTLVGQTRIAHDFDNNMHGYSVGRGEASLQTQGAWQGQALRMRPGTVVACPVKLQEASTYELTVRMRTESGADNIHLQLTGLGRGNVSMASALATWTEVKRTIHVGDAQGEALIEIAFDANDKSTFGWVDELHLRRVGRYDETRHKGLPPAPEREVRTDLDLAMQPDETIQWMMDDKLGMFIHWGLYAGPGRGEWYMENQGIAIDEYRKLATPEAGDEHFTARDYDPRKWVELARKVGMRYVCLTTQHHDGYALFESEYSNAFTSMQTHGRDFVREYVEACREAGLKVGLYKTLINWRYPSYYDITGTHCRPDNRFGYTTAAWHKENARVMKEELYCQVRELMTRYGKIDHLFWDGGWIAQQGSDADGAPFWESGMYRDTTNAWPIDAAYSDYDEATGRPLGLMGMVRKYQPDIVVNPRSGWVGDFTCEEGGGAVKGEIRNGVVEKCVSIAPGWGYNKLMEDPAYIMPLRQIKRLFADCMVRGMCFLLNVGPDRHGNIAPLVEERMLEFGEWVNATAEAIYGTRGGPWQPMDGEYGFCYKDNVIYVYLLGGYTADDFVMPPLDKGMRARRAYDVYTRRPIDLSQHRRTVTLHDVRPVKDDLTVIAVELNRVVRGK